MTTQLTLIHLEYTLHTLFLYHFICVETLVKKCVFLTIYTIFMKLHYKVFGITDIIFSSDPVDCPHPALRVESSQTNVILQYKLLAAILNAVCSVIQQS